MVGSGEGHRHPLRFGQAQAEDIATNAFNPYATSADLLDHQDENTTVLPGFRNKGVFEAPLVDIATAEK